MTIRELQLDDEVPKDEERERKAFETWFNASQKSKGFKMDGFKRKLLEAFDNTLIFDERPHVLRLDRKWDHEKREYIFLKEWGPAGGGTIGTVAQMWEAWLARARMGSE